MRPCARQHRTVLPHRRPFRSVQQTAIEGAARTAVWAVVAIVGVGYYALILYLAVRPVVERPVDADHDEEENVRLLVNERANNGYTALTYDGKAAL